MDGSFAAMYEADEKGGRPSVAPEKLMRAMLLQVLYSIRSERQLMEQISCNLLFRWFVGLSIDEVVWNHSVFSKNRDRLIRHDAVGVRASQADGHAERDTAIGMLDEVLGAAGASRWGQTRRMTRGDLCSRAASAS